MCWAALAWLMEQISLNGIVPCILCVTYLHMLDGSVGRALSLNVYFIGNYLQFPCPPVETQVFSKKVLALWGWKLLVFTASPSPSMEYKILVVVTLRGIIGGYECFLGGRAGLGLI